MTTTYDRNVVLSTKEYSVVGKRPIRHDGPDKVTGRAKYAADFHTAGTLHGKILRSPHAHAKIKSIDTSKAESLPGVRAVVTAKDLPTTTLGEEIHQDTMGDLNLRRERDAILASEKVLFKGHPIAGVAAINPHVADEALGLIDVEYDEILPHIMTAPEGMENASIPIHEDVTTSKGKDVNGKPSNVAQHIQYQSGDIEKGFAESDITIEREFNTATVHQGYIEPHACTVHWNSDDRIYIWNSTQAPFEVKDVTAAVLGIPFAQASLTPLEIGGGFGGKWEPYAEPVMALLSKKTGRPVKNVMTRTEEFDATGPTPGSFVKVKIGATKHGKLLAGQAHIAFEAGAWPGSVIEAGAKCVFAPYDLPNFLIDAYDVVVNKSKTKAYRAPGSTQVAFATETVVDELADELGIDPLEFRLMNAAKEGTRKADGPKNARVGCIEVLEAMKNHSHYKSPLNGPNQGRGVAVGFWFNVGMQSTASLSVNPDGTVDLVEGSTDIGGTRTSIAMQVAEELAIPVEDVRPSVVGTESVGYTSGTGGSRVTFATGWAAIEAARDVKRQMIDRAALIWGVDSESVEMEGGEIKSTADTKLKMTLKELAAEMNDTGGVIMGRGAIDPKNEGAAFAGNIVDVEVDPETGKSKILRYTVVQDAGKAIHPSYVEGQLQGGAVQGIGWALNEEYFMDPDGKMTNSSFLDYRMPTALDLPMIDTVIVEVPNPGHPYGVRGVGEVPIVPPPGSRW